MHTTAPSYLFEVGVELGVKVLCHAGFMLAHCILERVRQGGSLCTTLYMAYEHKCRVGQNRLYVKFMSHYIYIYMCVYGLYMVYFAEMVIKYTVIYDGSIRFWPTLNIWLIAH